MSEVLLVTGSSGMAAATARRWSRSSPVFIVGVDRDIGLVEARFRQLRGQGTASV